MSASAIRVTVETFSLATEDSFSLGDDMVRAESIAKACAAMLKGESLLGARHYTEGDRFLPKLSLDVTEYDTEPHQVSEFRVVLRFQVGDGEGDGIYDLLDSDRHPSAGAALTSFERKLRRRMGRKVFEFAGQVRYRS